MPAPFDPRKLLKQIANPLLHEFFRRRNELVDVPWDTLTEHRIEPIYQAWQALPIPSQREVHTVLHDVHALADHRGLNVLKEEMFWERLGEPCALGEQGSKAGAALWTYLHEPRAFARASVFARADALASGRHWIKRDDLPRRHVEPDEDVCSALELALTTYYASTQLRGKCCKVVPYIRQEESVYFFAYLDDFEEAHMVFDQESSEPVVRRGRNAFENVFVLTPRLGTLELFAEGGKKVQRPLQSAFARAVLGIELAEAAPPRPAYKLDHLLKHNHPLVTDPRDGVIDARMTRVRIAAPGSQNYVEVTADPRADRYDIYNQLSSRLAPAAFRSGVRALQATFVLKFQRSQGRCGPTRMTINVSVPDSCDLRQKQEPYRTAGERFLRCSGVIQ